MNYLGLMSTQSCVVVRTLHKVLTYVLGLRVVVHIPRVAVVAAGVVEAGARGVVGGGAAEKDGGGLDDGGDPGGVDWGLAQRLSQCAYGPPLWLSDRRPCADSALLHRQALL